MTNAYKCPKCKLFVIGDYCFTCHINIRHDADFFKDIFNEKNGLEGFDIFGEKNDASS